MENAEYLYRMVKYILFILLFSSATGCTGQDKPVITYPEEKIMNTERFDIEKFKKDSRDTYDKEYNELERKYPETNKYQEDYYPPVFDTLEDGTIIERYFDDRGYTINTIPPLPTLYMEQKNYYPTGIIKLVIKDLPIPTVWTGAGITDFYDEQGNLIKTTDDNQKYNKYKISLEKLMPILIDTKLIDPLNLEELRLLDIRMKEGIWDITHHVVETESKIYIEVDAQTGKIIDIEKVGFIDEADIY